jgi:Secretion system C-terminal sorting domain/PKD domain
LPVNQVTLSGSATDVDGTIASRQWSKVTGPAQGSITTPSQFQTTVTGLVQGIYKFELLVTDNQGAMGRDTVNVTVNLPPPPPPPAPTPNIAPIADAGDTIRLLNKKETMLNGTLSRDSDGIISKFNWKLISGQGSPAIQDPDKSITLINQLDDGVYKVELTVWDNNNASAKDTAYIIVKKGNQNNRKVVAKIYPNPAVNSTTLRFDAAEEIKSLQITVVDRNGKVVYKDESRPNSSSIYKNLSVTQFASGLYIVYVIINGEQKITMPLLKTNR